MRTGAPARASRPRAAFIAHDIRSPSHRPRPARRRGVPHPAARRVARRPRPRLGARAEARAAARRRRHHGRADARLSDLHRLERARRARHAVARSRHRGALSRDPAGAIRAQAGGRRRLLPAHADDPQARRSRRVTRHPEGPTVHLRRRLHRQRFRHRQRAARLRRPRLHRQGQGHRRVQGRRRGRARSSSPTAGCPRA